MSISIIARNIDYEVSVHLPKSNKFTNTKLAALFEGNNLQVYHTHNSKLL